ncbi:MAG: VOC family protein [Burkholderiales bacterium]|nr:VOC family protein [Burkholderiales bacterium]
MPLGIRHIEILVSNLQKSIDFYSGIFILIGWEQVDVNSFKYEDTKIYFKETILSKRNIEDKQRKILGPRHLCFNANNRKMVDSVGEYLNSGSFKIIRGPLEVFDEYHPTGGYYAVDFYDPDGFILEVSCN